VYRSNIIDIIDIIISVVPIAPSKVVFMLRPIDSSQLRFKVNPGFVNKIMHEKIVSMPTMIAIKK
jgi:hypothetical protein